MRNLLVSLCLVAASAPIAAQTPLPGSAPTLSLTAGPASIILAREYLNVSPPDEWFYGGSASLRLGIPVTGRVAVFAQGIAFRGSEGRGWQSALGGVEVRLGARRQVPVAVGAGLARQPVATACLINGCSADLPRWDAITHPALSVAMSYLLQVGAGTELGPEVNWTKALTASERYHSLHLGIRLTRRL